MSNEQQKVQLDPSVPAHAIEIVDQLVQPGAQMNRQTWSVLELCIHTLRKEIAKSLPVTENQ
jgi:hypothetical protein